MKEFGVDVSEHQGEINWEVAKNEIKYAILRIGWIGNKENHTIDEKFERNYNECKRLGIPIGIYVYNYCRSEEAVKSGTEWLLRILNERDIELPIFIDMEDSSLTDLSNEQLTNICITFGNVLDGTKYKQGIYANLWWFKNLLNISKLKQFKKWLAEWNNNENHSADFVVHFWQFTNKSKVDGIGNVDGNYCLCECFENINKTEENHEVNNETSVNMTGSYIVQPGDNLTTIAQKYGISWQTLYENNRNIIGNNPNLIKPGQVLQINASTNRETAESYIVKPGDNLTLIGKKYGISWRTIYENNKDIIGNNPNLIKPGQVLKIR